MGYRYRVTCTDHTRGCASAEHAAQVLLGIERLGVCTKLHTIEHLAGGEWLPLHEHRARQILAAPVGPTPIETPDGPLRKEHGTWSAEAARRADATAEPGSAEWRAALGPHSEATLTGDGRGVVTTGWCEDEPVPSPDTWVRYERYSARGREAHGYVCPDCRRLVQTG